MRNLKRMMMILCAVALLAGAIALLPAETARAAERPTDMEVSYVNAGGVDMGTRLCKKVIYDGDAVTEWTNGWYVINTTFYVKDKPINVEGTVNLILGDKWTFIADQGIILKPGSHLIIWAEKNGTGLLKSYGTVENHPGIGSTPDSGASGNLTINGGKIISDGGPHAPGIGGCGSDSGVITINGGTINAGGHDSSDGTPEDCAPGIGVTGTGKMNDVYFYGGSTTALSGRGSTLYCTPIGATDSENYSGKIHIHESMMLEKAKLQDGKLTNYNFYVCVNPDENKNPAYPIDLIYDENCGNVTTNMTSPVAYADKVITVTATPNKHYRLGSLTVTDRDGNDVAVTDGKFTMPDSSVVVRANFLCNTYPITVNANGPGTIEAHESADMADVVTLKVKPNAGCQLASLTVTDSEGRSYPTTPNPATLSIVSQTECTFTMPASAVTVTAEFETSVQKLTASLEGSQYGRYTVSVKRDGQDIGTATLSSSKLSHEFTNVKTGDNITVTFDPAKDGRIHKFYLEDAASREHHHEAEIQNNTYFFDMPGGSRNIVTEFAQKYTTESVDYVDEEGNPQTAVATVLTGYEPTDTFEGRTRVILGDNDTEESWYVVKDDITYKNANSLGFPTYLFLKRNVNLIIADGKTLTVQDSIENGELLSLYGQEKGTGKLVVDTVRTSTDVCSAELSAGSIDCSKFNVKNGKLTVSGDVDCTELSIVSGVTSITGQVNKTDSFTLGCADDDDRITIGSYYIEDGFINPEIAEGQTLTDGDHNYSGNLDAEELGQMAGKTLMLAHEHAADDLTRVEGVTPTYDPETDTYTDGVREHYKCEKCGGCFVLVENGAPKKESSENLVLKYFKFWDMPSVSGTLYLSEYNGTDRNVTVPDTVPESLYPDLKGKTITNIYTDAFAGHKELETVTVGSGLVNIGSGAFAGCTALTDFYTTAATEVFYTKSQNGEQDSFKDVTGLTIHAPHASKLYNAVTDYESQGFKFEPTDRHTVTWDWDVYTYKSATASFCDDCSLDRQLDARIWVSCVQKENGVGYDTLYEAAVVLDGEIYTDQKQTDHEHDYIYTAAGTEGRTIAQKCKIANCPHAEKETTFTIKPPARKIYGDKSKPAIATVDVHYYGGTNATGQPPSGYSIEYYKAAESGGVYTQGEKLNGAPTDAGTYLAVLTAPDRTTTASVGYTISRRPENAPTVETAINACVIDYTAETATPTEGYAVSADSTAQTEATPPLSLTGILDAEGTPTVYVRKVARNDNYAPSAWVGVTLASRPAAPTGLGSTNATNGSSQNGTITGVDPTMEYSADGVDWTDVSSTSITELNPGEYSVRVKATDIAPHGKATTVTIGSMYVALTDQNKPTITVQNDHAAPVVDDALTASCNATDIAYQWYRGDTPIGGATSETYTVTADDVGYTIKVVATQMTDAYGKDYGETQRPAQESDATANVVKKSGPSAPAITDTGFTPDYKKETFTVNDDYEVYSSDDETGAEITSLTAALDGTGKVYIRARETADTQAGAWLDVALVPRPDAPTGLTTANATNASTADGQIIGTTADMEYKQADSESEWTTATDNQTQVTPGTYLVRARATDSAPHGVAATVTVGNWQIILSDAQKPKARDLTYTGAPQKLVTPPEAMLPQGSKEMQYALGDATQATETYTTGIPEKTDAGTYYVWYMVVAEQPYYNSEPACIPVEIKSATSGNTAPGPQNRTYDGSGQPLVTGGDVPDGTGTLEYTLGPDGVNPPTDGWGTQVPTAVDPGTYYVWYRVRGDANHKDAGPFCIVVTIQAPAPAPAPAPQASSADYTSLASLKYSGKRSLKLSWTQVPGAEGYDVFFGKFGNNGSCTLKATVTITSHQFKKLKRGTAYKAYVLAWKTVDGNKVYIGEACPTVHAIVGGQGGKYTDVKKISFRKKKLTLGIGESRTVKVSLKKVNKKKKLLNHTAKVRYYSSDHSVATVNAKGGITGVGPGSCTVYAMAENGRRAAIKVTVN